MENKKKAVSLKNLKSGLGVKKVPTIGVKIEKIQLSHDNNFGKINYSLVQDDMSDIQEILEMFDKCDTGREDGGLKVNSGTDCSESPRNCNSEVEFRGSKKEFIIRRSVRIHTNKS